MKTLTTFFWIANILLGVYLGLVLRGGISTQKYDYQGIMNGISLTNRIHEVEAADMKKDFKAMYNNVEEEGSRPLDVNYLQKAEKVIQLQDSLDRKLVAFEKINRGNYHIINNLVEEYEQTLLATDTAIQRNIKDHLMPINQYGLSRNTIFQQLQLTNTQMYSQIIGKQANKQLSKKVGNTSLFFDKIMAFAVPNSKIVEQGEEYEATFILTKTLRGFFPKAIKGYGITQPEQPSNGLIHLGILPVTANNFAKNGECYKKWKAEITVAKPLGDTIYTIEKEYIIRKKL